MPYLELTDRCRFYYRQIGKQGPPVLMLHGFGNSSNVWLPYVVPLAKKYRFYLIDLPGHGKSKDIPLVNSDVLAVYADCCRKLVSKLGLEDIRLVGFSLGAYSGLYYLSQSEDVPVRSYLHIDHPPYTLNEPEWQLGVNPDMLKLFGDLCDQVGEGPTYPALKKLPAPIASLYIHILDEIGGKSFTRTLPRQIHHSIHRLPVLKSIAASRITWPWAYTIIRHYFKGTYDLRLQIANIKVPVTVLGAKKSNLFAGDCVDYLSKQIPNNHAIYFQKSGHDLMLNEPFRFFSTFRDFLSQ